MPNRYNESVENGLLSGHAPLTESSLDIAIRHALIDVDLSVVVRNAVEGHIANLAQDEIQKWVAAHMSLNGYNDEIRETIQKTLDSLFQARQ